MPIDFSSDLRKILSAVTWLMFIQGGLGLSAKFKLFSGGPEAESDQLPSWVADWRLASRYFSLNDADNHIRGEDWVPFGR